MVSRLAEMEFANRLLTKQLVTLQEEERAEIARDLHDEVGPFLFATGADAAMIRQFLATSAFADARARADAIIDSVRGMQKHLRTILVRLRPGVLADLGLDRAVRGLVEFWRGRRPDITFVVSITAAPAHGVDNVAFRLIQESLSNAVRHAQASMIRVTVRAMEDAVNVEVWDDGIGYASEDQAFGFGISGMSERVAAIGGTFATGNRSDGRGVIVSASLPLTQAPGEIDGAEVLAEKSPHEAAHR